MNDALEKQAFHECWLCPHVCFPRGGEMTITRSEVCKHPRHEFPMVVVNQRSQTGWLMRQKLMLSPHLGDHTPKIRASADSCTLPADTGGESLLCLFRLLVSVGIPRLTDTSLKMSDFPATLRLPSSVHMTLCACHIMTPVLGSKATWAI